jgi:hypothetical protein
MDLKEALTCGKCSAKMLVDRVFLSYNHLELYCLRCGKREMFNDPQKYGERVQWIMKLEIARAKKSGSPL